MEKALPDDLLADIAHPDWPRSTRLLAEALDDEGDEDEDGHHALDGESGAPEQGAGRPIHRRYRYIAIFILEQVWDEVLHAVKPGWLARRSNSPAVAGYGTAPVDLDSWPISFLRRDATPYRYRKC